MKSQWWQDRLSSFNNDNFKSTRREISLSLFRLCCKKNKTNNPVLSQSHFALPIKNFLIRPQTFSNIMRNSLIADKEQNNYINLIPLFIFAQLCTFWCALPSCSVCSYSSRNPHQLRSFYSGHSCS